MKTVSSLLSAALAVALLTPSLTLAADPKTAPAAAATTAPTAKDIADAKAKGLVWVNTKSGAYFKHGRAFGKTPEGKFMTEADAKAAGYHVRQYSGKRAAKQPTETK